MANKNVVSTEVPLTPATPFIYSIRCSKCGKIKTTRRNTSLLVCCKLVQSTGRTYLSRLR